MIDGPRDVRSFLENQLRCRRCLHSKGDHSYAGCCVEGCKCLGFSRVADAGGERLKELTTELATLVHYFQVGQAPANLNGVPMADDYRLLFNRTAKALRDALAALERVEQDSERHLVRANEEIVRRERAEVAYTLSEQKRLTLIDRAERVEKAEAALASAREEAKQASGCDGNCGCEIGSRHFWWDAFCKEREALKLAQEERDRHMAAVNGYAGANRAYAEANKRLGQELKAAREENKRLRKALSTIAYEGPPYEGWTMREIAHAALAATPQEGERIVCPDCGRTTRPIHWCNPEEGGEQK